MAKFIIEVPDAPIYPHYQPNIPAGYVVLNGMFKVEEIPEKIQGDFNVLAQRILDRPRIKLSREEIKLKVDSPIEERIDDLEIAVNKLFGYILYHT